MAAGAGWSMRHSLGPVGAVPETGLPKAQFAFLLLRTLARLRVHENRITAWRQNDGGGV